MFQVPFECTDKERFPFNKEQCLEDGAWVRAKTGLLLQFQPAVASTQLSV